MKTERSSWDIAAELVDALAPNVTSGEKARIAHNLIELSRVIAREAS